MIVYFQLSPLKKTLKSPLKYIPPHTTIIPLPTQNHYSINSPNPTNKGAQPIKPHQTTKQTIQQPPPSHHTTQPTTQHRQALQPFSPTTPQRQSIHTTTGKHQKIASTRVANGETPKTDPPPKIKATPVRVRVVDF